MIIAIDFDGTCVSHDYPRIGNYIGAQPVLRELVREGHKLVLNTMRSGKELDDAVKWFKDNDIELYGINETPGQKEWTSSPKVSASIYIDDRALGCPLCDDGSGRPCVSWKEIAKMFGLVLLV